MVKFSGEKLGRARLNKGLNSGLNWGLGAGAGTNHKCTLHVLQPFRKGVCNLPVWESYWRGLGWAQNGVELKFEV